MRTLAFLDLVIWVDGRIDLTFPPNPLNSSHKRYAKPFNMLVTTIVYILKYLDFWLGILCLLGCIAKYPIIKSINYSMIR